MRALHLERLFRGDERHVVSLHTTNLPGGSIILGRDSVPWQRITASQCFYGIYNAELWSSHPLIPSMIQFVSIFVEAAHQPGHRRRLFTLGAITHISLTTYRRVSREAQFKVLWWHLWGGPVDAVDFPEEVKHRHLPALFPLTKNSSKMQKTNLQTNHDLLQKQRP